MPAGEVVIFDGKLTPNTSNPEARNPKLARLRLPKVRISRPAVTSRTRQSDIWSDTTPLLVRALLRSCCALNAALFTIPTGTFVAARRGARPKKIAET